jgi:hypothetical protein
MKRIQNNKTKSRKALLSMELVLTLPLLMLVLFAVFEYSMLFFARGGVVEASRIGARTATYPGASLEVIEQSVVQSLGPQLNQNVSVFVEPGQFSGDRVVVVVKVPMAAASPDLLWPIGFGLQGRYLIAETVMERE